MPFSPNPVRRTLISPCASATSFLRPVPDRDATPTGQPFVSAAYQDMVQRQPTHPDGPTLGWDLGLNLLGDPITAAEHKSLEGHQTKIKLRRLRATNIALEILFGLWGIYTTVRYCVAFAYSAGDNEDAYSLVLGILSALAIALVTSSIFLTPLFPRQSSCAWRYARTLARACYLLLLSTVLQLGPRCSVAYINYEHRNYTVSSSIIFCLDNSSDTATCRDVDHGLLIYLHLAFLQLHAAPNLRYAFFKYASYFASDPEEVSPMSTHTLNRSNTTLPKYNSISTLALSTSCTGHSCSHCTPPCKDIPPKISPPTSRSSSGHATNHVTRLGTDGQSRAQSIIDPVVGTSHTPSNEPYFSHTTVRWSCRDPSEIRSWKPGHRGISTHVDIKKASTPPSWEGHARQASHTSTGSTTLSSTAHEDSEFTQEKSREDDGVVYAYGYGAFGPTYPYLDMYNPQRPERDDETSSSSEDLHAYWAFAGTPAPAPSFGLTYQDIASSSSRTSSQLEVREEDDYESTCSDEEEEYVAMMGGFVRRMATIESLGSKEASGTLSTTAGSVARHRDVSPSRFSSGRFSAYYGTSPWPGTDASTGPSSHGHSSLGSTVYFSLSSGETGTMGASGGMTRVQVNERGELLPGPSCSDHTNKSAASSPYD
ncbi:hypothetical protein JVU11DRAFT_9027 [Chiua virens]|nr:hypothetical protein JVU11DRAFT_9027 [Chiua virens]